MKVVDLYNMDCRDAMSLFLPDNSVDAIVCDPPYGLSFMGKKWDYDVPGVDIWAECLRVLKPGGHLLAFAGTRTQHRMAVRIEDAGFEIRDLVMWHYGQGFPKSKNLGGGFGSALKPATEPITMARKPCVGTLESNFAQWGTGGLNIDGCRVGTDGGAKWVPQGDKGDEGQFGGGIKDGGIDLVPGLGRWPANLIHDGSSDVVAAFPQAKGQQGALTGSEPSSKTTNTFGEFAGRAPSEPRGDTGSAARFFYCAKASKKDRDEGLESFIAAKTNDGRAVDADNAYQRGASLRQNIHPTVKPTDLMAYLCRLVTPPGGVVFDPFMGSGSTGKAALREGFGFIGCELDAAYFAIAEARLAAVKAAA